MVSAAGRSVKLVLCTCAVQGRVPARVSVIVMPLPLTARLPKPADARKVVPFAVSTMVPRLNGLVGVNGELIVSVPEFTVTTIVCRSWQVLAPGRPSVRATQADTAVYWAVTGCELDPVKFAELVGVKTATIEWLPAPREVVVVL